MKNSIKRERRFVRYLNIEIAVTRVPESISKIDYGKSFKVLIGRFKRCVYSKVMYFEYK